MINQQQITRLLVVILSAAILQGCANFNYKRFTYDILRQEDCRRNDIDPFCARSFVFEYDEYEQLRQEYIQSEKRHSYGKYAVEMGF